MAYIAQDDPVFVDGFCVEDVDQRCWKELAEPLKELVLSEAAAGNKAFNIGGYERDQSRRIHVQLNGPAKSDMTRLPAGLALRKGFTEDFPVYDGEMYAVFDLASMHHVSFTDPEWKDENIGA